MKQNTTQKGLIYLVVTEIFWLFIRGLSLAFDVIRWIFWEFSGARAIWEKIFPPSKSITDSPRYKRPATIGLWVFSIYFAILGYTASRHERILNRAQSEYNTLNVQLSSGMTFDAEKIKNIGKIKIAPDPHIEFDFKKAIAPYKTFINPIINSLFHKLEYSNHHYNLHRKDLVKYDRKIVTKKNNYSDFFLISMVESWKFCLKNANLNNTNLQNVQLDRANLEEANLAHSNLFGAKIQHAHLKKASLTGADLTIASLKHADLSGAELTTATLALADLTGADLTAARLNDADLSGAEFTGADLSGAQLRKADLTAANLRLANLTGADLLLADLTGARLQHADLSSAILLCARLRLASLSGASLKYADLTGADLRAANLRAANLSGADLSGADLSSAILLDADLSGANLFKAIFTTERLLHARNLTDIKGVPENIISKLKQKSPELFTQIKS